MATGDSEDEPWDDDDPRLRVVNPKPRADVLLEFQWSSLARESDVAELLQRIGIDIATVVRGHPTFYP